MTTPIALVPTMTSNTAPYGRAFSTSANSSHPAYYAFDGKTSTVAYGASTGATSNIWIGYEFKAPVRIKKVKLVAYSASEWSGNVSVKAQGSTDGSTWVDITDVFKYQSEIEVPTTNNDYYKQARLYMVSSASSTTFDVKELQFYGKEQS